MYIGAHYCLKDTLLDTVKNAFDKDKSNSIQIFTKSPRQINVKSKILNEDIKKTNEYLNDNDIKLFIHATYAINLCIYPNKHLKNLIEDLNILDKLDLAVGLVVHFGHYKNITEEEAITNFKKNIHILLNSSKKKDIIIETSVSKNAIGSTYNNVIKIYESFSKRVSICIDTCHIFQSGYNITIEESFIEYFKNFYFCNVSLLHLNDSKKPFNYRIDNHEDIGDGYIFNNKKSKILNNIVEFCKVKKISIILETPSAQKFKKTINLIRGNKNETYINQKLLLRKIIDYLQVYYKLNLLDNEKYKARAYSFAIYSLSKLSFPYDLNDKKALEKVDGIGNNISDKILKGIKEKFYFSQKILDIIELTKIKYIDVKKLLSMNIHSLASLKKNINNKKLNLNEKQKFFIYYEKKIIQRDTISQINSYIKKKFSEYSEFLICGSYIRKQPFSNDIDIIVNENIKKEFIEYVSKFFNDTKLFEFYKLSKTSKKQSIIYISSKIQIDFIFFNKNNFPFMQLYFTGSKNFNIQMRLLAKHKGYKLTQYNLENYKKSIKSEKDIFDALKVNYIEPSKR